MLKKTMACRHGMLSFFGDDQFVGKSLELYGDFSEDEVSVFKMVLRPQDVAVEVGSNIGALTVPMAQLCKRVYAFEPQPENFQLLKANIEQNDVGGKVHPFAIAISSECGQIRIPALSALGHTNYGCVEAGQGDILVEKATLDSLLMNEPRIRFVKIDCEGMELEVLKGAEGIIKRDRPMLYVENDRREKSAELVGWLIDHDYRCFWHQPPLFYQDNFRGQKINAFGNIVSINMVCFPSETNTTIKGLEEIDDHRISPTMYEREAARMLKRLERDPKDIESRFIAAHYYNLMGDHVEARKLIAENLAIEPNHVATRGIEGLLKLQDGDFHAGWQGYELRYHQTRPEGFGFRPHPFPHWDGKPTDEVVLLWGEQGFGDSIMFGRFIADAMKLAPNAIVEVQSQLYELFENSGLVPQGRLFRIGRALPAYSMHCSLPSIPATLKFTSEAQVRRGPYLFADPTMTETWLKRSTPRIGVCCKGGVASERAYSRDIPSELIDNLPREYGPFMTLEQLGQWESYADTAAAISALDLVITVDTSVAHLAGALGVPTWLMLSTDPDWRWQRDRTDSPWYSSMRIFRQKKFMDWSTVIADIEMALSQRKRQIADAA